jgi:hypothetical protein
MENQALEFAAVHTWLGVTCGVFDVTDLSAGLDMIKDELASLEALPHAFIGWLDWEAGVWCGWHPRNVTEPFSKTLDLMMEAIKAALNLVKRP